MSLVDTPDYDPALPLNAVQHLYLVCNETPIEKDKPAPLVQTATAALAEIMSAGERGKVLAREHYPALLCTLLMRVGTAFGVDKGASSTYVVVMLSTPFACDAYPSVLLCCCVAMRCVRCACF